MSTTTTTTSSSKKTFSERSGLLQLNMSEEVMIGSLLSCGALIGIVISSIIPPSFILRVIGFFISFGIKSFWFAAVAILVAELTSRKQRSITSSLPKAETDEQETESQTESPTESHTESVESTPDVDRHSKPALSIEMQQRKNHNITQSMPPLPKLPLPGLDTPTADQIGLMRKRSTGNKPAEKLNINDQETERVVFHSQPSPAGEQQSLVKTKVDAFENELVQNDGNSKSNIQEVITLKPSTVDDKLSSFTVLSSAETQNNSNLTNESQQYDPDWTHEKDDITLKSYGSEVTPAAQEEMNSLRGRLQNLYTIIRQYKTQVNQLNTRLHSKDTQLTDIIRSKHESINSLNKQISDFQHKCDELNKSNHFLMENIKELEQQNHLLKEELRVLEHRLQNATTHSLSLNEDEVVGGVDGLLSPIQAPHVYESLVDEENDM